MKTIQLNKSQYISSVLTNLECKHWARGDRILIRASTGTGKNHFAISYCNAICEITNSRALILTNRILLLEQIKKNFSHANRVDFMSYQTLQKLINSKRCDIHKRYDIIVCDETHYFFADSPFAYFTDLTLDYLLNQCNKSTMLFLSATTDIFQAYMKENGVAIDYTYFFVKAPQYGGLFYWSNYSNIRKLLDRLSLTNEKAILFTTNVDLAYKLSQEITNSRFICSDGNPKYSGKSQQLTKDEIKNNEKFKCQFLFTTTVLDNGVNLNDPDLKHIIIDIFDYDSILQCLGRRRHTADCNGNPVLPTVYLKQYGTRDVISKAKHYLPQLDMVDFYRDNTPEEFCEKYAVKSKRGLMYTKIVNGAMTYHINTVPSISDNITTVEPG